MAQNLLSKLCAKLVQHIKNIIVSEDFIGRHRFSKKDFTRQRKLPFHLLIAFLINFVRGSYQDELDRFFKALYRLDVAQRVVSKVAFTKARMKLKAQAFIELNHHLVNYFETHFKPQTWHGFRLLAIDGSMTRLPVIQSIAEHFGLWGVRKSDPTPMARVSQLFDVLNKVTIDATIQPKTFGERALAAQHLLTQARPNDLILLDRGYPASWIFNLILSKQAHFCARISATKWKIIRRFLYSGLDEKTIELPIYATSAKKSRQLGLTLDPLQLRLVRLQHGDNVQVLVTSLLDKKHYPVKSFHDLYHCRWPVEEDYKAIKCRLELENFSGKSTLSIYQDFHAKIFVKNLVSVMAYPLKTSLQARNTHKKYDYQINFTQALSKTKSVIALLFQEPSNITESLITSLQDIFQRTIEPIRPGRKFVRNHKVKRRKFFLQYKPIG